MRNNEVQAVIGINQLKKLDKNNKIRSKNFNFFLKHLDGNKFFTNFLVEGSSNYAFPLILNYKSIKYRNNFEKYMKKNRIEFRRGNAGGGNQMRQPYLKNYVKNVSLNNFKNVEIVHSYGYYIGNYPSLSIGKIKKLVNIINSF